jgi:hypothetical protein
VPLRFVRLAAAVSAALVVVTPAGGALRGPAPVTANRAPTGLKAFLLRADDSPTHTFSRTPSFAWSPVPGALRYEFELGTSRSFADSGTVWTNTKLTSPVASVPIALPWITGKPHSLYAHVRAITRKGTTPWSAPYGFDMRWTTLPRPQPSYPGLLRWTTVPGANRYQVWLVDPGTAGVAGCATCSKIFTTLTNVADEREYYTLHQDPAWTAQVHWRIRAVRTLFGSLENRLPAVSYGPWSPIYTSANPAFAYGPLTDIGTLSDTLSNLLQPAAHKLMPAFLFSGNQSIWGVPSELYRVYVFTDQDCLNTVFTGAVVGGPAYAPRASGPLALPADGAGFTAARTSYLPDGSEGTSLTADGAPVVATESAAGGGKTDLWDSDWPTGRYYWTVMPVEALTSADVTTTLSNSASVGATSITVGSANGLAAGDTLEIGTGLGLETAVVASITGTTITLKTGVKLAHAPGESVLKRGGAVQYRDTELTQEACAAGRVLTFGKTSEPVATGSLAPYASGLSPQGQITGATKQKPSFYGVPLVAWQPALGADEYEVQWSRTAYPWNAVGTLKTLSTSATLPLSPGTWYYRIRGVNHAIPGAKQQMTWSSPVAIVVAKPRYKVVR